MLIKSYAAQCCKRTKIWKGHIIHRQTAQPTSQSSLSEQCSSDTKGNPGSMKSFVQAPCWGVPRGVWYSVNRPGAKSTKTKYLCLKFWLKSSLHLVVSRILSSLSCQKIWGPSTAFFLTQSIIGFLLIPFCLYSCNSQKFHYLNCFHPLAKVDPNLLRGYKVIKSNRTLSHKSFKKKKKKIFTYNFQMKVGTYSAVYSHRVHPELFPANLFEIKNKKRICFFSPVVYALLSVRIPHLYESAKNQILWRRSSSIN